MSDVAEVLIDSPAWDHTAGLLVNIVGLASQALRACTLDDVVTLSAVALATVEVVNLVGSALNPANPLVNVIDLASWALSAVIVDQVISWLADASA